MKSGRTAIAAVALLIVLGLSSPASAEVSVDIHGPDDFQIIILGITEGPDPFGMWEQVRDIDPVRVLNTEGAIRRDGRPDVADPDTGSLLVTWAYRTGTDFDIAVSEWTGSSWSETQFLTHSTDNELDPNVFIDKDGTAHVVWWVQETQKVYVVTRHADTNIWSTPAEVTPTGTTGQYPSVVVWNGLLHVSYERRIDPPEAGIKEVVVMRRQGPAGTYLERVIARSSRKRSLDVRLHSHSGVLWADWLHSYDTLGFSEGWATSWDAVRTTDWLDSSWVGVEDGRSRIRSIILNLRVDDTDEGLGGADVESVGGNPDPVDQTPSTLGGDHLIEQGRQ